MLAARRRPADTGRPGKGSITGWIVVSALLSGFLASAPTSAAAAPPAAVVLIEVPPALGATWEGILSGSAVAALEARGHRASAEVIRPPTTTADEDASDMVADGIAAYDELGYTLCVERLSLAIARASRTGAAGLSRADLADAFLFRGLARRALGDTTSAFDDFHQAAVLAAGRSLDPARFAPAVRETYERARATVASGERGTLLVRGPPGAAVLVDATPAGVTPARLDGVPYGAHFVRVDAEGHAPWSARVEVGTATTVVNATPAPLLPVIDLTDPAAVARLATTRGAVVAATLSVSGDPGAAIITLREVDPGTRTVRRTATSEALESPAEAAAWIGRSLAKTSPAGLAPELLRVPRPRRAGPVRRALPWILSGAAVVVVGGIVTGVVLGTRGPAESGFTLRLDLVN